MKNASEAPRTESPPEPTLQRQMVAQPPLRACDGAAAALPSRPALRWFGGKWRLAPWIVSHFPSHRVYVEPFGGAASVLLRKPRSYAEVYNDLDDEVVTLFRVLRGEDRDRLIKRLALTPFARGEFEDAYLPADDPVEQAARLVIRSFMGFGSNGALRQTTGFRANSNRSGTTPAHDWTGTPDNLRAVAKRFAAVVIERRPAVDVMRQHDGPEVLHYVDPPYVHDTRSRAGAHRYRHEMTDDDHRALLGALCDLEGMVVLSGYASPLYDDALGGWLRVETEARADGALARVECLWLNQACAAAQPRQESLCLEVQA